MARAGRAYPNRPVFTRSPDLIAARVQTQGVTSAVLAARSRQARQVAAAGAARPLVAVKKRTINPASASGTATATVPTRMRAAGHVTGVGATAAVVRIKRRTTGQAATSGVARTISGDPQAHQVVTSGTVRSMRLGKAYIAPRVVGVGQARTVNRAQGGPVGQAASTGNVLSLRGSKTFRIGRVAGGGSPRLMQRRTPPLRVGLPIRSWSARFVGRGRGGVEPMSSLSLEYLEFFVENASGSEQVEVAFTAPGQEPTEGQWHPASWGAAGRAGARARIRVGPGALVLVDGTYQGWVRVTTPSERPVLPSGLVPIT
ncbi:hypothetical protein ACIA8R_43945 [Nonomuraea sp. NPDC051191]|uniref:hypothetical protein n=1 Tax=Nonomuraea sp. NPDC051191 TaxID=3364372 RepID=UPI0037AF2819